jgi:predicted transcriptional regulator
MLLMNVAAFEYDINMSTQSPTDAEVFQRFLAEQVATAGRSKSPEELLRIWRERQREQVESLEALREGLADMEAGRVYPFDAVNNEIRHQYGWSPLE